MQYKSGGTASVKVYGIVGSHCLEHDYLAAVGRDTDGCTWLIEIVFHGSDDSGVLMDTITMGGEPIGPSFGAFAEMIAKFQF